jgi:hypothetical protein
MDKKNEGGKQAVVKKLAWEKDPFLTGKVMAIVFALFFAAPFCGFGNNIEDVSLWSRLLIAGISGALGSSIIIFTIIKAKIKNYPDMPIFPGEALSGLLFYLCIMIDLGIPIIFFFGNRNFIEFAGVFGSVSQNLIIGPMVIIGLLIFTIYGFIVSQVFPNDKKERFKQLGFRLLMFAGLYFFGGNMLDALFMYGLIDTVALSLLLALYLLGHYLFVGDKKKAQKIFTYHLGTIIVSMLFGIPSLIFGTTIFICGYVFLFQGTLPLSEILHMIIWLLLLIPVFKTYFQFYKNYTEDFYSTS